MTQCLRIVLTGSAHSDLIYNVIQKNAKQYDLEGTVQVAADHLVIVVCGSKDHLDNYVDSLHKHTLKYSIENIEIEPFFKDKDYRGVFRVIE